MKGVIIMAALVAATLTLPSCKGSGATREKEMIKIVNDNRTEGKKFLKENGAKEGVVTTESGLQYRVLAEGKGAKPVATDTVEVHYEGRLLDGTVFDSSYERKESIRFPLQGVIPGWTEGLQYMMVGSKYRFFIKSSLGYGARGAGDAIPPNATLIFDVELLSIGG